MIAFDLNKSFQVIRMIQNENESGEREIPTLVDTIRGRISAITGNRQLMYDRETYTNTCRLYCLYNSKIAQSDYIRDISANKSYKIISINNPSMENDHLEIDLTIMESGQDLVPGEPWINPEDGIINGGKF